VLKKEIEVKGEKKNIEEWLVDYYSFPRFIPSQVYKQVWGDNHKFMFERHIYNDSFFKFVKEICSVLQLPEVPKDAPLGTYVHPEHKAVTADTKKNIRNLVHMLSLLIFYILSRARDSSMIGSLSETLRLLLSLYPEAAYEFFEKIVMDDLQNTFELFLNCPDDSVSVRVYST
jgi:hypothetical protein